MKLDSALNAQVDILSTVLEFTEVPGRGDGPQSFVAPKYVPLVFEHRFPLSVNALSMRDKTPLNKMRLLQKYLGADRTDAASGDSQETDNIAIGISAGAMASDYRLTAIYQDRKLVDHPIFATLSDRYSGEIDFLYVDPPRALPAWHVDRIDPLQPGASVGHPKITAGTIGCFVREQHSGAVGILSNNHILANVNFAEIGDPIFQPGPNDGGDANDIIATLANYTPIHFGGDANKVDCAWAALDNSRRCQYQLLFDSTFANVASISSTQPVTLMPLDPVVKLGRTTGYTQGEIIAIQVVNLAVMFGEGLSARFDNVIMIEPLPDTLFSAGGDSGSIVLRRDGVAGGLLFAGSEEGGHRGHGVTFANPLDLVLNALDLKVVI